MKENKIVTLTEILTNFNIPRIIVEKSFEEILEELDDSSSYLIVTSTDRMHYIIPKNQIRLIQNTSGIKDH